MEPEQPPVDSPCIKLCVLNSDRVCVGCGRTADEIGDWGYATEAARREIRRRADRRMRTFNSD